MDIKRFVFLMIGVLFSVTSALAGNENNLEDHPATDKNAEMFSVSPPLTLPGETSASITACIEDSSYSITKVVAIISPPENPQRPFKLSTNDLPIIELINTSESAYYSNIYNNFSTLGTYLITIKAWDIMGNESQLLTTTATQTLGPDVFENDDTQGNARVIIINAEDPQTHSFHDSGDADWIKFYGIWGNKYTINLLCHNDLAKPVISFYGPEFNQYLPKNVELYENGCKTLTISNEGIFYIEIKNENSEIFGENSEYTISLVQSNLDMPSKLFGRITDIDNKPIKNVRIKVKDDNSPTDNPSINSTLSFEDGAYLISVFKSQCTLTIYNPCYIPQTFTIRGDQLSSYQKDIQLNHTVISILQIISGFKQSIDFSTIEDIGDDQKIGIEESLYMFEYCRENSDLH